jgi:periplasmic protein TonB
LLVVVLIAGFCVYLMVRSFLAGKPPPTKKVVQEIHVIRPPPPPPDEPPPPPPPEEKVDVHEPDPEPDPTPSNEPPPSEQLGLDAEGGAGSDAFGLAGRPGGRDLLASGGSAFNYYGGLAKNEINEQLQAAMAGVKGSCSLEGMVAVKPDGSFQTRVVKSSGDQTCIKGFEGKLLGHMSPLSQGPPANMPPILMRFSRRE